MLLTFIRSYPCCSNAQSPRGNPSLQEKNPNVSEIMRLCQTPLQPQQLFIITVQCFRKTRHFKMYENILPHLLYIGKDWLSLCAMSSRPEQIRNCFSGYRNKKNKLNKTTDIKHNFTDVTKTKKISLYQRCVARQIQEFVHNNKLLSLINKFEINIHYIPKGGKHNGSKWIQWI